MTKTCRDCKLDKPFTEFYKDKNRKDGYFSYCKCCSSSRQAHWRKRNPQKRRESHLAYFYGLSPDGYRQLLSDQGGKCAICQTNVPGHKGNFVVDHNHKTGKVRGLLCAKCNAGLGHFRDKPTVIEAALSYLISQGNYG